MTTPEVILSILLGATWGIIFGVWLVTRSVNKELAK